MLDDGDRPKVILPNSSLLEWIHPMEKSLESDQKMMGSTVTNSEENQMGRGEIRHNWGYH